MLLLKYFVPPAAFAPAGASLIAAGTAINLAGVAIGQAATAITQFETNGAVTDYLSAVSKTK